MSCGRGLVDGSTGRPGPGFGRTVGRLRSLRDQLNNIRRAMEGFLRVGQPLLPEAKAHVKPDEAPWRLLELVDRYHATAEALDDCGRLLGRVRLHRYRGDYAL